MRREPATVVVLVGEVDGGLLAELARSPNVSVAPAPDAGADEPAAGDDAAARPGWEPGAAAMKEAARRRSTYVVVPDDPLAEVAARWRAMWETQAGAAGAAGFEKSAAEALAAWRAGRFELPDYYLVTAPALHGATGADLYLGPLHAMRPRRVAVAGTAGSPGQAARLLAALRSLEQGPWWPPLDDLIDASRRFYAGGLAATPPLPR